MDNSFSELKNRSLFARLKRLFSNEVVIRNVGGKKLKIIDTDQIQYTTDKNSLRDRFNRLRSSNQSNYSKDFNLAYQSSRVELFRDFDTMSMDPILASALDIYADECTSKNELGDIITIKSSNGEIKDVLDNLFYDILNIEFNLWSWTRSMVKYGDFYLRLYISPEYGIYMVEPLSCYNVKRLENYIDSNKHDVKFEVSLPEGNGSHGILENYEVAHFRLLQDTNFIPYGTSMLDGARRIWKQLNLMEDAMLIHRIMRAPEKRKFKIDIGNIPPNEIDNHVEQIMNKMKKVPYIDENTGDYNLRFNLNNMIEDFYLPVRGSDSGTDIETIGGLEWTGTEDIEYLRNKMMSALKIPKAFLGYEEGLCISPDTLIPLLNGKTKTVKSIIDDYENGIKNYVYSIDENTHNIVPGEIEWAGYTRMNTQVVRVHIDNEKYIDCTPDHLFMTRDGRWVEAQNLKENQPLMPFYVKESNNKYIKGYTQVYNPSDGKYKFVHRIVSEYYNLKNKNKVCHHKDFDKLNNYPDNLDFSMNFKEHREFHSKLSYKTINSPENIKKRISDPNWLKSASAAGKKGGSKSGKLLGEWVKNNGPTNKGIRSGTFKSCPICNTQFYEIPSITKETCSNKCANEFFEKYNTKYKISKNDLIVAAKKSNSFKDLEKNLGNIDRNTLNRIFEYNNIECKKQFVYDYMPLALNNKGFMNNINSHKINYKNHIAVKVEFLDQKIDTCDLTIKNHHNFATSAGVIIHNSGKSTLAAEDIRFARTIQRIQRIILSELNKIAVIHLYSQGYKDESLVDFELELTNPSTIFEREKIEIWKDKVDLSTNMQDSKLFSKKWIYEHVFGLSDEDMIELQKELVDDSKSTYRFNQIEEEGSDPAIESMKLNGNEDEENPEGDEGGDDFDLESPSEPNDDEQSNSEPTEPSESPNDKESSLNEKKDKSILKNKKRDQSGRKKASDYPFGEDPLGTLENNRNSKRRYDRGMKSGSPLSLESYADLLKDMDTRGILVESKNSGSSDNKSYMDENNIKE